MNDNFYAKREIPEVVIQEGFSPLIAIDAVGAGAGEQVFFVTGKEASFAFLPDHVPADASIVGIVDRVYLADS